jgi:hypothetical protein
MHPNLIELRALALELSEVAEMANDPLISRRLTEMADEVLGLFDHTACESRIYQSATFIRHTGATDRGRDSDAHDTPPRQAQRN